METALFTIVDPVAKCYYGLKEDCDEIRVKAVNPTNKGEG